MKHRQQARPCQSETENSCEQVFVFGSKMLAYFCGLNEFDDFALVELQIAMIGSDD
jgi:hypothetical protein